MQNIKKNISILFLLWFWNLETSSRPFYDFKKITISHSQFYFSNWWLTILIATGPTFKRTKNLKVVIIGLVTAIGWKIKKGL